MRIAICDNDTAFLAHIQSLLEPWAEDRTDFEIEAFSTGEPLIKAHAGNAFDIILLDTVMDELDGIEVAREIRAADKDVKLVFLASSPDYAVESYTVKASNYLLKPIEPADLLQCMDELENAVLSLGRRMALKGVRSAHYVSLSSIECIEALGRHVAITLTNGDVIESTEPLYSLQERLFIDDGFFRCHRSHIVNINHIASCTSKEITMRSGRKIPIARGCQHEFKKARAFMTLGNER